MLKNLARSILLFSLFISFSALVFAQGFSIAGNPQKSFDSETFTTLEGRFSISLPEQPHGFQPLSSDTPNGRVRGNAYNWTMPEARFSAGYTDMLWDTKDDPNISKSVYDYIRNNLVSKAATANGKLISERDVTLAGNLGRELKFEFPDGLFIDRIYLVKGRLYQVMATLKGEQLQKELAATRILDTFKVLTQSDIDAGLRQKIAKAQPSPLPQEPAVKKSKSDAEDQGIRGKVKTIVSERADLSVVDGKTIEGKREPASAEYYNESGNLLRSESYDWQGNPRDITVYGYIDGDRASNYKSIRYEYDPPPPMAPPAPASQPKPTYDPRYSNKYRYKYEGARMVEKLLFGNDGKLRLRYVYNYKGNQKEELVYKADGELNQRYLSVLDKRGNEVEETSFNVKDDSVRSKYSYSYEFDSKGNWIKRVTSKWVTKDGKSYFEPAWVTYRTITYY